MFTKLKNRIEKELTIYSRSINKLYTLNNLSPILFTSIKEFILREGKRIRPILFCIGYLGYSKRNPAGLYRSALSLELLHDFMLVHDDIIDKSDKRRGKPSMHALLKNYLPKNKEIKFSGQDMAIVVGDVMYAMALDSFMTVKENRQRKEEALKKLIAAALYTGSGEFIELLLGIKPLERVTLEDIYKIYDHKTAKYTFSYPLTIGATLAGAKKNQIELLNSYGLLLGRAFQIKDDIIGTFGNVKETGKSNLTDLREAKRTILLWYAFKKSRQNEKQTIKKITGAKSIKNADLTRVRKIIVSSGALNYAKEQIVDLRSKSLKQLNLLKISKNYKEALDKFSQKILKI